MYIHPLNLNLLFAQIQILWGWWEEPIVALVSCRWNTVKAGEQPFPYRKHGAWRQHMWCVSGWIVAHLLQQSSDNSKKKNLCGGSVLPALKWNLWWWNVWRLRTMWALLAWRSPAQVTPLLRLMFDWQERIIRMRQRKGGLSFCLLTVLKLFFRKRERKARFSSPLSSNCRSVKYVGLNIICHFWWCHCWKLWWQYDLQNI